jgi:hypothetical protein
MKLMVCIFVSFNLLGSEFLFFTNLDKLSKGIFWKITVIGKGKAIPLWAWTGPEGSRRLRLPDFKPIST